MKKTKLALSLSTALVSVVALSACAGVVSESDGNILTYNGVNYTAEELFADYDQTPEGAQAMFDSVYRVAVRNYFNEGQPGASQKGEIERETENEVNGVKSAAEDNAELNGTNYDDEFEKLLDSNGAEDEDELYDILEYELMLEEFNEQFYDKENATFQTNVDIMRDGGTEAENLFGSPFEGYLEAKSPYHIKHILVKVDAAANDHTSSTISEANAKKLEQVVTDLASGISFGETARLWSDDGSAAQQGELDIMDRDTSYVNPLKLGTYLFDTLYNGATEAEAKAALEIPDTDLSYFGKLGIGQIPYGEILRFADSSTALSNDPELTHGIADITTDSKGALVENDSAVLYPRNVLFNKYFNNSNIAVITPNEAPEASELYTADANGFLDTTNPSFNEAYIGDYSAEFAALPGFSETPAYTDDIADLDLVNNPNDEVLRDQDGNVIIAVRAGTEGESGYQGIHFFVVERSPFMEIQDEVTLSEYWTTKYPSQEGYPTNADGDDLNTYVNYFNNNTAGYKDRATQVQDKIKGFNPHLNTYMYEMLVKDKLVFSDTDQGKMVEETINNWISTTRAQAEYSTEQNWETTWRSYTEYIQNAEYRRGQDVEFYKGAEQLISETAVLEFQDPNKSNAWTVSGGLFYED